jgi:hypothetical protein
MVNNTQNYWLFGCCPSSGFLKKLENTTFRKQGLFFPQANGAKHTLLDSLEIANLNYCFFLEGPFSRDPLP